VQVYLKMDRVDQAEKQVGLVTHAMQSARMPLACRCWVGPSTVGLAALRVAPGRSSQGRCRSSQRYGRQSRGHICGVHLTCVASLWPVARLSQVKAMTAVDDDATLTQLATAWVGLHQVRCARAGQPRGVGGW
jgi:hypothetical protein